MKKRYCLAILVFFFALNVLTVCADESVALLEARVSDQSVVLYVRDTGSTVAQARIAFEDVADVTVDGQDGTLPITTWLLVDNSFSIKEPDRERAKELLIDLVSSQSTNEAFTLCTFAEHLNPIIAESRDYSELKQAIESIQHYDQETYLTDCLDELLALETARADARYVRIVVISDGVDNNPSGITRDELEKKLEKNNFPVYSIGCAGNAQELKEMYAISRQTGARYWALNEVENYDITQAMSSEEIPTRIKMLIPASLCDGTTKGVQVTFDDGTSLQTQVDMPFGEAVIATAPAPVPAPTPDPMPEQEPTPPPIINEEEEPTVADWMRAHWLPIVAVAFCTAAFAIVVFLFLQRKKPQKDKTDAGAPVHVQGEKVDPPRGSIFLGKEEGNDITIDDSSVSKRHCAIAVSGDNITVYDLDSLNGTLVDDVKLEKGGHRQARSGSTLTLANVKLEMEICTENYIGDATWDSDATIYFNPEDIGRMASGGRILRITDISRRNRCYEVPLPDVPGRSAQIDGRIYNDSPQQGGATEILTGGTSIRLRKIDDPDKIWNLMLSDTVKVGREESCQVFLNEGSVSRFQCVIYSDSMGSPMIENRSNSNPTQVNRIKIASPQRLSDGDQIKCGRVVLLVDSITIDSAIGDKSINGMTELINA